MPILLRQPGATLALVVPLLLLSWLGMMIVHESGHIVLAWMTGGTVEKVVLHPLAISRTDVSPNPRPLAVVWGGPVMGVLVPLASWGIASWSVPGIAYLLRFFAGFCLVANGLYLGIAPLDAVGDSRELLRLGASIWSLVLFGAISTGAGFLLWNRQGEHFGLGESPRPIPRAHIWGVASLLAVVFVAEMLLSSSV
ncbi:MAG: hypothetical protein CMJ46_01270 [Planctomyces sp.]|nr:hypothetical protein [Planctomyces sp.]